MKRLSNVTVTFCGHSTIKDGGVKEALFRTLQGLLSSLSDSDKVTFLCGGYGAFDWLCSDVIDEIKTYSLRPTIEKVFVTPYITESYKNRIDNIRRYFDEVVFPPLESVPPKFAISRRNEWMVDRSDIVIAYVWHGHGGAAKTLRHAYIKKKNVVRLISDYDVR